MRLGLSLLLPAVGLWVTTGCSSDVCPSMVIEDAGDLDRVARCRIIDGELLAQVGSLPELALPALVEVRDRLVVRGFASVSFPALQRVGTGISRGDVVVTGLRDRADLSALETVGLGAFAEDPNESLDRAVTVEADPLGNGPTVDLARLTSIGSLALGRVGLPDGLPAADFVHEVSLSAWPEAMLPDIPEPARLTVRGSETLETLVFAGPPFEPTDPNARTRNQLELVGHTALTTVRADYAATVRIDDHPALTTVTLEGAVHARLDAENNRAWSLLTIPRATALQLWARDIDQLVIEAPALDCIDYQFESLDQPPDCP